ncbi:hypothetical protein KP806_07565 [Paenibacillus sp. N4]|uniref:hypothetical protein n=1 Tax=Paenibacillus vietnamensis TaxID=2590547 RepID=UPI001CD0B2A5|nr:hypothetical protein [Paenibacillus vietnamensis]MCA0754904.1 hypothetical protein [Paenibacillus vietnamensis]
MSEYNMMTPWELFLLLEQYGKREKMKDETAVTQAYLTAHWQRVKKMPSLEKVLKGDKPKRPKKPQTAEDMLEEIKRVNAAMGGTVY